MGRSWHFFFVLILAQFFAGLAAAKEETTTFGRFGTVSLYYQSQQPTRVVLFISGDGGWNLGVVDMARELAGVDALVIGIDITHYLKQLQASTDRCLYPAFDLEELSKFAQKKLGYAQYTAPVLVGYSSGATLAYATLVQAPSNTFRGAISLGFCPDLLLTKPMCRGSDLEWEAGPKGKGYNFKPSQTLEVPWVALQGEVDQVCSPKATADFVKQVPQGEIVSLPKVGHGFSVPRNWMPQFKQAFARLDEKKEAGTPRVIAEQLKDLPLIEVPTRGGGPDLLAVFLTGDGGWGVTDRGIAEALAAHGIPGVGLNSLHYFWTRRTPDGTAQDLERILRYYLETWKKKEAILIGYSFGADVLPFALSRLPKELRAKVRLVGFLGLGGNANFEFHLTDWLVASPKSTSLPVRPEVEKLRGMQILCFYGTDDTAALCKDLDPTLATAIPVAGGHRFGSNYEPVIEAILREATLRP